MYEGLAFTTPPEPVQKARRAIARAQLRIALDLGTLEPGPDLSGIALAICNLENVYPPYFPLGDVAPSANPRKDIILAIGHLTAAIAQATTAADIARYAASLCDLRDLDLLGGAGRPSGGTPSA